MTKTEVKNNNKKVPFDPGFAPYVLVFSMTYDYMNAEVRKFKNANQRKMKYKSFELGLLKLCDNLISFYFGGMLYGAYLKNKYSDSPRELDGNDFYGWKVEDCEKGDVVIEVSALEKFIKGNDKNPFATRKLNPKFTPVIDAYIEFLKINNYFTDVKTTADIKIPKIFEYVNGFSKKQLDELYATLIDSINSKKIEKLLSCSYFEKL